MANYNTRQITSTALMAAVVFVATMVVKIPVGQGSYRVEFGWHGRLSNLHTGNISTEGYYGFNNI